MKTLFTKHILILFLLVLVGIPKIETFIPKNINLAPLSSFSNKNHPTGKTLRPKALFTLTKDTKENQNIAYDYSLMKMGDVKQIKKYSQIMATYIKKQSLFGRLKNLHIVTMRGQVPNFASLLSQEVARQLNLDISYIDLNPNFKEEDPLNYALITEKTKREEMLNGKFILTAKNQLKDKNIIFIDDSIVSGAVLKQACAVIEKTEAKNIFPLILAKIDGKGDHSFENTINRQAISKNKLRSLIKMLNNPDVTITSKLLNYTIQLDTADFNKVLSSINLNSKISLYLYTFCYDNFRFKNPSNQKALKKRIAREASFIKAIVPDTIITKEQSIKIQQLMQKHSYNITNNTPAIWKEFIAILTSLDFIAKPTLKEKYQKSQNIFFTAA